MSRKMKRSPLAAALIATLVAAGYLSPAAPAAPAAPERPKPPLTSELRARTPDGGSVGALEHLGTPTRLPNGATRVFPDHRVVSLYGAPQMSATILGRLTPFEAWRRVRTETERYRFPGAEPPVRAFELVVSIATGDRGYDGRYRSASRRPRSRATSRRRAPPARGSCSTFDRAARRS